MSSIRLRTRKPTMTCYYTIHIEPAEEGGFCVSVPALPGCFTQGERIDEVLEHAREAIGGYIEVLQEHGETVPIDEAATDLAATQERSPRHPVLVGAGGGDAVVEVEAA